MFQTLNSQQGIFFASILLEISEYSATQMLRKTIFAFLAISEYQKQPFSAVFDALNFDFVQIQPSKNVKIRLKQNLEPVKMSKWQFLRFT